jgi:hypothetical protein
LNSSNWTAVSFSARISHCQMRKYANIAGDAWLFGRGPFLTSPLGANFDPRGEFVPQGWILSPGV